MKILAFAASNSLNSINKQLVTYACEVYGKSNPGVEVEIIDLNDFEMPLYRPDREKKNGVPEQAKLFFKKIGAADALIISFAEYNGSYTTAYKNIFDWTSRIDQRLYQGKSTFLMATSPGKRGGANVLKTKADVAPFFGMEVKETFSLPQFQENFDPEKGKIINTEMDEQLRTKLQMLI